LAEGITRRLASQLHKRFARFSAAITAEPANSDISRGPETRRKPRPSAYFTADYGLPAPSFPCDFHLDFTGASERDLAVHVLRQARELNALAWPDLSPEALFLVFGAARLLAADPLIVPPPAVPERLLRSP
jgi:hypothetical protein